MPPVLVTFSLILFASHLVHSSPIAFDVVNFTKSNFTPVEVENIRGKLQVTTPATFNIFKIVTEPPDHSVQREIETDSIKFIDTESSVLEEGSLCRRSYDGASGYCLLASQCRHVFREFRSSGTKIDVCGYDGINALVCCPFEKRLEPKRQHQPAGRISAEKCAEYSKLDTVESSFVRLVGNPAIARTKSKPLCRFPVPLIVGGVNAAPGEFPHMAAIGWVKPKGQMKWACGGSLISEQFVLSAAHCAHMSGIPPTLVRLGKQNIYSADDGISSQDIKIRKIITHPSYNSDYYYNDIALIQLDRNVEFTKFIKPACLWQSPNLDVTKAVATGWGRLGFHGRRTKHLQKVELNLIDRTVCNRSFEIQKELYAGIANSQICAGHLEGGKDTCQGDSGGPLQVLLKNNQCMYHIIGITSFGKFCAAPNMPGVYTNIYSYLDWIEDTAFRKTK